MCIMSFSDLGSSKTAWVKAAAEGYDGYHCDAMSLDNMTVLLVTHLKLIDGIQH